MFNHVPRLLRLAFPLILSSSAVMTMQIIDTIVLSWHSAEAVAAMGPSSLAVILFQGFLYGIAAYAGTFVAHSHGRGDSMGVKKSTWMGIHAALFSGLAALIAAWPLARLFLLMGHDPLVARYEMTYFWICMAGSFFPVAGGALAGWLSGIGRTLAITWVMLFAFTINAVLTWALVLGRCGLPQMGIAGAAIGTVTAEMISASLFTILFARAGGFGEAAARRFEWPAFRHFLLLAVPVGLRISGELVAWTLFLVIIGRLGVAELAASSIAFRINGLAFFPAIGLAQAAGILVGQARGAGKDHDVPAIAWQSLAVGEAWMLAMALLFALAPAPLMSVFAGFGPESAQIVAAGILILKFVALYCILDAANIIIGWVLAAAGDTRWLAWAYCASSGVFLALLWLVDRTMPGLVTEWTLATIFIGTTAVIWMVRFQSGAWQKARVLRETVVPTV
ncbi:MATE family efflux transporter [Desulfosudis oleivorans]|uniref:Multidrug-efflux transporter n=1 Tax=Desulfosudis oleivorans (strain DSM 6200 / JCM 39069 / Hxd3) TaxID=96561 RepID=A8ZTF9_DESOH|nr:MATE family efflux transporter [Desulfosudis oleivorans]ABW66223.1 MATE efflux family protein [Desulfosudis oleivorans Hxd3]